MAAITKPLTRGIAVLSRDPLLGSDVSRTCAIEHYPCMLARELAQLELAGTTVLVVDAEHPDAAAALAHDRDVLTIVCARSLVSPPGSAASRALVARPALAAMVRSIARAAQHPPVNLERLVALALVNGPLEHSLAIAAEQITAAFHVERCVISVRGDSTGATSGTQTWSSVAWSETADRCRIACRADATLVAPATTDPAHCESIIAVPLESRNGGCGFLGLIARGPRIFSSEERRAIASLGARLSIELDHRLAHERTLDELDRCASAPGIDNMLGIWNRAALDQLTAMYASAAERFGRPLTAMIVDFPCLPTINGKHGIEIGDRVLRRVADALRTTVRTEDVIGRWAGDKIGLLLQGMSLDGAQRLSERIHAALDARHVELRKGEPLPIRVRLGISMLEPHEEPASFVERAVGAALVAPEHGLAIAENRSVTSTTSAIEIGEELRGLLGGTYRLVHEISRGGMGVVYRAEDVALERAVAVKMLRPDLAEDHAFIEQLRREAALLARVQHPNLVQVYSFGQVGGDSYFVMELVEGESLRHALERFRSEGGSLPLGELVTVVGEVALALDTLHELGIIHRDVKPDNVIRDPFRGRSVLVDVGIARRFGQTAASAGTPGYAAPEVIRGEEATPRSDVYGLAAMTYALLTLHEPWGDGDATAILTRQLVADSLVPVAAYRPELTAVDDVLRRALSIDPELRPTSALQFTRELQSALPALPPPIARRSPITMILPRRAGGAAARTRGVVFRSLPRAFGAREAGKLRDTIGASQPELARVIGDAAPLEWLPTDLLVALLSVAPPHLGRHATLIANEIARASVRATFRRFFPASAATLAPERTLLAVRNIWSRYQSWGEVTSMPVRPGHQVVKIANTMRLPELCAWAQGMIEQLVVLSGGTAVKVGHEACEVRGDRACLYEVSWQRA
ncbi:MAG TPA: diguanylate cyclase [Kofleriaceae bacterium]